MLCAAAGAAEEVWVVDGAAEDVASLVAVLLHAPRAATVASAAIPVTTVLVFFTTYLSLSSHSFGFQPSAR